MPLPLSRLFVVIALALLIRPPLACCQDRLPLHRVAAQSPQQLRELFHYDGSNLPLVSAHRGGAVPGYPENCLETFEHTLAHTYSMLEIDLRLTKEGRIVLLHDTTLDRTTTGSGTVAQQTVAELKQLRLKDNDGTATDYRIPTLDETLRWARGKTIVILDKKDVSVEICVKKIQEHHAQAYAMVMAYSFADIETCHRLDPDIMMEVMIGNQQRLEGFDATGVPWNRVIAFVGHNPPENRTLIDAIHARGACCMAGTSRNLDRQLRDTNPPTDELRHNYQSRLEFGIDLIETDLPIQVAAILRARTSLPPTKAQYFRPPMDRDEADTNAPLEK